MITQVEIGSPAERAGLRAGDRLESINGLVPRDVLEYHQLVDDSELVFRVGRSNRDVAIALDRDSSEPLGITLNSPVFDRIQTCDNHCAFCFIYQLPKGLRRSLYTKDDDYRLSFLYGNFTTLTRFTEADFERVLSEKLSPLYVSIHATDPTLRADMLRNQRGATSLRWLRLLLDEGVEVHGQIVVCPGVNDAEMLSETLYGVLDSYRELSSVGIVPLGVSRFNSEPTMRPHTEGEAEDLLERVHEAQAVAQELMSSRLFFASDECYLIAGQQLPPSEHYEGFAQLENGVGMLRNFEASFKGTTEEFAEDQSSRGGFFSSIDAAPAWGYRERIDCGTTGADDNSKVVVLTGGYAGGFLTDLVATANPDAEVRSVENSFFGGNISVAGLLCGSDVARAVNDLDPRARILLPANATSGGRFLDGVLVEELGRSVELVVPTGAALRLALGGTGS